jgi:hypothetical protein
MQLTLATANPSVTADPMATANNSVTAELSYR